MLQPKKSRSQVAVGGSPSTFLSFSDVSNTGTGPRPLIPTIRETSIIRNMVQGLRNPRFDRLASAEQRISRSPDSLHQSISSVNASTNSGENDTAHDQPGVVSPVGEIAIDENDIIIAVMGPTGTGKSSFVDRAVGRPDTGAGHDLTSCTKEIRPVRCPHPDGERNIVLIDTPGFNDTLVSDTQILRNIAEWLESTYKRKVLLSGLLYFHRISDNRMAGTPLRNLSMFKELCGRDNFKNVVLVTTMWDHVSDDEGLEREEELQNAFWQSMISFGSSTHRFLFTEKSAWDIINTISLSPPGERRPLQIQREMVDENKPIDKTSAGKAVLQSITDVFSGIKGFLRRSRKGPKIKMDNQAKSRLTPGRHLIPRTPSSSSISSDTSYSSSCTANGSFGTTTTNTSMNSGFVSEEDYRTTLRSVITDLKLAQSVTELARIHCLKEVIITSLCIAQALEAMERTQDALFRVVENASLLISVIAEHARQARLTGEVESAISDFASYMRRADEVVQNMTRNHTQDIVQDADFRTLSACAGSIKRACDVLRPKLLPENRQRLHRLDVGLSDVKTKLKPNRARFGMINESMRHP